MSSPTLGDGKAYVSAALAEAQDANEKYGLFASMHEAYGVLAEEVAELFEAVRMPQTDPEGFVYHESPSVSLGEMRARRIRAEAIQVAAVALRIAEQAGRVRR